MRIKCVVEYDGTFFQGWQKQDEGRTIQGEIECALSQVLNQQTSIYASGRTDAGVHAKNQVFHFDANKDVDIDKLRYSLNRMLDDDIYVKSVEIVDNAFHSRFSLKDKTYSYRILFKEKSPLEKNNVYVCPFPTNTEILEKCLNVFVGKHNFKNFTSKEEDESDFVREIYSINLSTCDDGILCITFKGNGFMRYMIRYIVGVCLSVSQGKENFDYILAHLDSDNFRDIVSFKAPACGLTLENVSYQYTK